jgi:hypothetical protein
MVKKFSYLCVHCCIKVQKIHERSLTILIVVQLNAKKKDQTLLTGGLNRVTSRDTYQSIDLIEYYKSYKRHKELGRGRQVLEGAKVNFFLVDFLHNLNRQLTQL